MILPNQISTEFYVVFKIKKDRWGSLGISAVRLAQKKPTKLLSTEFFTKMEIVVPKDYIQRPEPHVKMELTTDQIGDLPMIVAEKLREE